MISTADLIRIYRGLQPPDAKETRMHNGLPRDIERVLAMTDAEILAEAERGGLCVAKIAADGRVMFEAVKRRIDKEPRP